MLILDSCAQQYFGSTVTCCLDFSIDTISVKSFKKIISHVKIIDARTPKEHQTCKIKGAQFVSFEQPNLKNLNINKSDIIIVYCTIGYRSEKISEELKLKGYKYVYNLYGGIIQWVNKGNKVFAPKWY